MPERDPHPSIMQSQYTYCSTPSLLVSIFIQYNYLSFTCTEAPVDIRKDHFEGKTGKYIYPDRAICQNI